MKKATTNNNYSTIAAIEHSPFAWIHQPPATAADPAGQLKKGEQKKYSSHFALTTVIADWISDLFSLLAVTGFVVIHIFLFFLFE